MATTKPRITITLEPDQYAVLARLAALQGSPMARIVSELMSEVVPTLEGLCNTLEAAKRADAKVKAQMRKSMEAAEADLMPLAQAVLNQMDMFQESLVAALGTAASLERGCEDGEARSDSPASRSGSGPHPVITGATTPNPRTSQKSRGAQKVHHQGGK